MKDRLIWIYLRFNPWKKLIGNLLEKSVLSKIREYVMLVMLFALLVWWKVTISSTIKTSLLVNSKLLIVRQITPPLDVRVVAEMALWSISEKKDSPLELNTHIKVWKETVRKKTDSTNLSILISNTMVAPISWTDCTRLPWLSLSMLRTGDSTNLAFLTAAPALRSTTTHTSLEQTRDTGE